jgi:hypothetical protein
MIFRVPAGIPTPGATPLQGMLCHPVEHPLSRPRQGASEKSFSTPPRSISVNQSLDNSCPHAMGWLRMFLRLKHFLTCLFSVILCIAIASALSYLAFYSFWFAASSFHSVPVARACDAVGMIFLLPARILFFCFGSAVDQSMPLSDPVTYSITNGTFLGILLYSLIRPILFRNTGKVSS